MLRWTDTCILVSSCIEVPRKRVLAKDLLKIDSRESRTLFGALFLVFSVDPRIQYLVSFSCWWILHLLCNEILHFAPAILIPIMNFFGFSLIVFIYINVASSSYSAELLPAFCRPSHSRLLISYPHPASLFPRVAVELNRAQQPVLQTKKRFRRCPSRPFPFLFYRLPPFSLVSIQHDCAWFCEGTASPPSWAAPFLIFPGTIVSAW